MAKINLRIHYTFLYEEDEFIQVPEEIACVLKQFNKKSHADYERRRVHRAYYSLDLLDGITLGYDHMIPSPEEIYEQEMDKNVLYNAILELPEKQMKRIYAHYFLEMSASKIARIEGVDESSVRGSIKRALKKLRKQIKME